MAIIIDPTYPTTFKFSDGTRYFPMGDTAYELMGQTAANIESYIDSRVSAGFNFIRFMPICNGFWPLGGTPGSPDYTTINETQLQKLDDVFTYAATKGMNIELILWGYGVVGGNGMWGNTTNENFWVDTIVNRYKDRPNLFMWTVVNEFERYPNDDYTYAEADATWAKGIATRIKGIDSTHGIGVHPSKWISDIPPYFSFHSYSGTSQRVPQVTWPLWNSGDVSVFNVQNNQGVQANRWVDGVVYEETTWESIVYPVSYGDGWTIESPGLEDSVAEDLGYGKPVVVTEFGYQWETGASDPTHQTHTQDSTRKKAWKIATSGGFFAAGFAHSCVAFDASKIATYRPEHLTILYNFFQTIPYWKMTPNHGLVAANNSLLARPGAEYVAYFPSGGANNVRLAAGIYSYDWINPTTGEVTPSDDDITVSAGNQSFTPPFAGDAVLHIKIKAIIGNALLSDGSVKTLLRFEPGALLKEEASGNSSWLTASASPPTSDTTYHKEGSGCAAFASANSQYYYINDNNLPNGFPTKNGDTTKTFSTCFWVRFNSLLGNYNLTPIITKDDWPGSGVKRSFRIYIYNDATKTHFGLMLAYNSGASVEYLDHAYAISASVNYHVTTTYDNDSKVGFIRIKDENGNTVGTDATKTFTLDANKLFISDAPLRIASVGSGENYLNGYMDEIAIFRDVLADSESIAISKGIFGHVLLEGSTCWGHSTGVTQANVRAFTNWTGTGTIENSGDTERIKLESGQYMESEVVNTGAETIRLKKDFYQQG